MTRLCIVAAYFCLVICPFVLADYEASHMSTFYEGMDAISHKCSTEFDEPRKLDCACVRGLWILYGSCSENITLAGSQDTKCYKLEGKPIVKAVQVLQSQLDLAAIRYDGSIRYLETDNKYNLELSKGWVFITGSDWTIVGSNGRRICLSVIEPDSYCYFSSMDYLLETIVYTEKGCDKFDYFVDPEKCDPISGNAENICELVPVKMHTLVKRQAEGSPAAGNSVDIDMNAITEDDEDYEILQSAATKSSANQDETEALAQKIVADAILEFMENEIDGLIGFKDPVKSDYSGGTNGKQRIQGKGQLRSGGGRKKRAAPTVAHTGNSNEQLDVSNRNPLNSTYANPVFEFLEISKRIMYKTCPAFYVKPVFLNLAVSVFIRLQHIYFKLAEHTAKPVRFRRILENLRKCEQAAGAFKFAPADYDGKVNGTYTAYGQMQEMTLPYDYVNLQRDPLVETVWKVFFNAHSYCFPYFSSTLDHHRFTAWMVPLFQNKINDIWTSGVTTEKSYNGLFGNQIDVQRNLAYCAGSSRLDSAYPFDLPRPSRVYEIGHGNGPSSNSSAIRAKRDTRLDDILMNLNYGTCMDHKEAVLCPDHFQSLAGL